MSESLAGFGGRTSSRGVARLAASARGSGGVSKGI